MENNFAFVALSIVTLVVAIVFFVKVISSREQDPEQAKEWALSGANGKWEKNKAQSKDTIYKPNFESCRLGG